MTVNHWVPGSSPGRGAKFKNPAQCWVFYCLRTLTRDSVPGYSLRSPFRGHAEARSAALSSPGREAKFERLGSYRNAVHLRLHTFGSPLPFMGEGLGERAENTANLPGFPSPKPSPQRGEGTNRVRPFLTALRFIPGLYLLRRTLGLRPQPINEKGRSKIGLGTSVTEAS